MERRDGEKSFEGKEWMSFEMMIVNRMLFVAFFSFHFSVSLFSTFSLQPVFWSFFLFLLSAPHTWDMYTCREMQVLDECKKEILDLFTCWEVQVPKKRDIIKNGKNPKQKSYPINTHTHSKFEVDSYTLCWTISRFLFDANRLFTAFGGAHRQWWGERVWIGWRKEKIV